MMKRSKENERLQKANEQLQIIENYGLNNELKLKIEEINKLQDDYKELEMKFKKGLSDNYKSWIINSNMGIKYWRN